MIGRGIIHGGYWYGVEGGIRSLLVENLGGSYTNEQIKDQIKREYGYGIKEGYDIPNLPDWDPAPWASLYNYPGEPNYPADRINFHYYVRWLNRSTYPEGNWTAGGDPYYKYGSFKDYNGLNFPIAQLERFAGNYLTNLGTGSQSDDIRINSSLNFGIIKKTIKINTEYLQRYSGYEVNAQFFNCQPLGVLNSYSVNRLLDGGNFADFPGAANSISISKKDNEFTIFICFPLPLTGRLPYQNRTDTTEIASFAVIHKELLSKPNRGVSDYALGSEIAPCIYPTVQFQIFGIPKNFSGDYRGSLSTFEPTITLT